MRGHEAQRQPLAGAQPMTVNRVKGSFDGVSTHNSHKNRQENVFGCTPGTDTSERAGKSAPANPSRLVSRYPLGYPSALCSIQPSGKTTLSSSNQEKLRETALRSSPRSGPVTRWGNVVSCSIPSTIPASSPLPSIKTGQDVDLEGAVHLIRWEYALAIISSSFPDRQPLSALSPVV